MFDSLVPDGSPSSSASAPLLDWKKINEDYEKSGLSRQAFCAQHQLSLHQFMYQRQQLPGVDKKPLRKLASIVLTDTKPTMDVSLGGMQGDGYCVIWPSGKKLLIPRDISAVTLHSILTTLGESA